MIFGKNYLLKFEGVERWTDAYTPCMAPAAPREKVYKMNSLHRNHHKTSDHIDQRLTHGTADRGLPAQNCMQPLILATGYLPCPVSFSFAP